MFHVPCSMNNDYYTRGEKEYLLKIARQTLEKQIRDGEKLEPQTVNQKLWEKRGVFVSLYKVDELRGCIGVIGPVESLIVAIRDNVLSASRDPRFLPVDYSELEEIDIEISILTPLERITFDKIKKGDGVMLKSGEKSTTYLPQVWKSLSLDCRDEALLRLKFLSSLCQKAGLSGECYKDNGIEFYKYEAIVFDEKSI